MEEVFRYILPEGGSHKGTSTCQTTGCGKSTREGKPFCSKHIDDAPYIQTLVRELEKRDAEILLLEKRRAVPDDAHLIRETLLLLRMNPFTVKGLARRLDITHNAADALINQVCRRKLAIKGWNARGEKLISGLTPPELQIDEK